tara:strand:+ start:1699 stop:2460 length:762 start_codon:yes stop_codon:yes gene_type:complete
MACPSGEEPTSENDTETEENGGGSTPCASDSDCGLWGACVQGVCAEGATDGATEGTTEGSADGDTDGSTDGDTDGSTDGDIDGSTDGSTDGDTDGSTDGDTDGSTDGNTDGSTDGSSSGDVNLALTASAEASEEWSTTWSAEKAIDGDMTTYWSTADDLVSATFTVTLSETKMINKIILNCGDYPMKSFELLVSNDGSQYVSIGQYDTLANEDKTIEFTAQNASHVRLDSITADPGPAWTVASIYELEIYEAQ